MATSDTFTIPEAKIGCFLDVGPPMSSQGEMGTYLALTGNSIAGDGTWLLYSVRRADFLPPSFYTLDYSGAFLSFSNKSGTNPDCSSGVTSVLVNKGPADERPNWSSSMPAETPSLLWSPSEKNIGGFVLGNTPNSGVPALSAEEALARFEARVKGKGGVWFKCKLCNPRDVVNTSYTRFQLVGKSDSENFPRHLGNSRIGVAQVASIIIPQNSRLAMENPSHGLHICTGNGGATEGDATVTTVGGRGGDVLLSHSSTNNVQTVNVYHLYGHNLGMPIVDAPLGLGIHIFCRHGVLELRVRSSSSLVYFLSSLGSATMLRSCHAQRIGGDLEDVQTTLQVPTFVQLNKMLDSSMSYAMIQRRMHRFTSRSSARGYSSSI
ncbi:hypothetical protein BS47DRAFT_1386451 [Hydnum rufescens UP504]|uniref:Uncharacterized protein n=1 Tax=Hydnum rufescens UP504 TaxID=1448309 RepID=A0A9P6DLV4_9AGAM|nr:hypothetical protein BS47DRAFT_1386451 [Hydnum rufescens UP504]